MKRFLLVDTSDRIAMVGIYEGTRPLAETKSVTGRPSLMWVNRSVQDALKASRLTLRDIHVLACGVGPGGFTSLRIGLSFMKAIGQSLGIPVIGVNRLEAAAMGQYLHDSDQAAAGPSDVYLVRLPAAQNLEYAAVYRMKAGGLPDCLRKPAALPPEKISRLRMPKSTRVVAVRPELFFDGLPRVAALKAEAGLAAPAEQLQPLYLRGATLGPPGSTLKALLRRTPLALRGATKGRRVARRRQVR